MAESERFNWGEDDVEWEDPPKGLPTEPDVRDDRPSIVPEFFPRESGAERLAQLSAEEQDKVLGPDVAAALRDGTVRLPDLVVTNRMDYEPDFITQASAAHLGLDDET